MALQARIPGRTLRELLSGEDAWTIRDQARLAAVLEVEVEDIWKAGRAAGGEVAGTARAARRAGEPQGE